MSELKFWVKVRAGRSANECWPWPLSCHKKTGYGQVKIKGKMRLAHCHAFFLANGYEGKVVRHTCDNPPCCNPDHLLNGTHQDNSDDAVARGRRPRGEQVAGSFLTQEIADRVRSLYETGEHTQVQLAAMFGTKQPNVSRIIRRETWTLST